MSAAQEVRWNHNIHYFPVILSAVRGGRVLDVGCGEGVLTSQLARQVDTVVGIDPDQRSIDLARRDAAASNVEYVVGDVMAHPFEPGSFDAAVAVAVIHHIGNAAALTRMRELVRPGGIVAVIGLARSEYPRDLALDLTGAIATRALGRVKPRWETISPKVWPPAETYPQTRRTVGVVLPGATFRRHVLWRWSAVWTDGSNRLG